MQPLVTRRSDREKVQVGNLQDGITRYYDHNLERTVVKLMTGDCYFSPDPQHMLVTILGSCISVCVRDTQLRCGGMNHILLPDTTQEQTADMDKGFSLRFGAYAMENLLNGLYKLGAQKSRLEVKVFGGANLGGFTSAIGQKNAEFVLNFLRNEGIPVASKHVGGSSPRRIHYFPDTGKVMMRQLRRQEDFSIVETEKTFSRTLAQKPKEIMQHGGEVELF